jgi:hypothetical protein
MMGDGSLRPRSLARLTGNRHAQATVPTSQAVVLIYFRRFAAEDRESAVMLRERGRIAFRRARAAERDTREPGQ